MPNIRILLEGDGALPELADGKPVVEIDPESTITITALPAGMESGRASVGIHLRLPDGTHVFAQTSLRLFVGAAQALNARHGD